MRNASPRMSSPLEEKKEENENEVVYNAASTCSPPVNKKTVVVGKQRRRNSRAASSLSLTWILMQLLAPIASMVAILQLLHYIRHSQDNGPLDSSSNSSSNSLPRDYNIHSINSMLQNEDSSNININNVRIHIDMTKENLDPALQGLRLADCMYFWAPSAIANADAGWGVFTAIDMKRGAITQSMPDLCFEYNDVDDDDEHNDQQQVIAKTANAVRLESFIWSRDVLFPDSSSSPSSTLGRRRVLCQGMASLVNSMPDDERRTATSKVIPAAVSTTISGKPLSKKNTPRLLTVSRSIVRDDNHDDAKSSNTEGAGVGAWLFQANHKIPAGSEFTIEYYKQDFTTTTATATTTRRRGHLQEKFYDKALNITVDDAPRHPPEWLRQHGKCLDHVEIKTTTTTPPHQSSHNNNSSSSKMGRRLGAFATRHLVKGSTVLPAPVLVLANPKSIRNNSNANDISPPPLPLWVNYCFKLRGSRDDEESSVLFFPYTPGIGAINHNSQNPNVALRWSQDDGNDDEDDVATTRLTNNATPGTVIYNLEVYALNHIRKGDEIVMDYGSEWETAYQEYQTSLAKIQVATKQVKDSTSHRPVFRHSIMLPESLLSSTS